MQKYYQRASVLCTKGSPHTATLPSLSMLQVKVSMCFSSRPQVQGKNLIQGWVIHFLWLFVAGFIHRSGQYSLGFMTEEKRDKKIPPDRWQYFVAVWQGIDLSFATIIEGKSHVILILIYYKSDYKGISSATNNTNFDSFYMRVILSRLLFFSS